MTVHAMPKEEPELHPDEQPFAMDQAEARITELAKLSALDYERCREAESEAIGARVSILDKMVKAAPRSKPAGDDDVAALETAEPWPQPVDGLTLAEEIESRLRAYVVFRRAG